MKTAFAKKTAIATALFIALTSPALASRDDLPFPPPKTNPVSEDTAAYHLVINGKRISSEQVRIYVSKQHEIMLPVRDVVQHLGYRLTWRQDHRIVELTRGKQRLQLRIGEDRYSIGTLRLSIGAAPELINGKTYIPLPFLDEVLKANVSVEKSGKIMISSEEIQTGLEPLRLEILGTVGKIVDTVTFPDGSIQVTVRGKKLTDTGFSLIKLTITPETQIIGTKGNKPLSTDALKKGDLVYAFYGPKLTKSIPPIGTAQIIIVENRSQPGHL